MPALPPVLEVKRTLAGAEKRFECRLLAGDDRQAVVLWVSPQAMQVHGVELPAGTVTFGHYWTDRFYNVYQWMDRAGRTLGHYFNIADETRIAPELISWRDLVVDVLATPSGRLDVLDRDELPADLAPEIAAHLDAGLRAILDDPAAVLAEIAARSRPLAPLVFTDAA